MGDRPSAPTTMQVQDQADIVQLLAELRLEHRDLDAVVAQLATALAAATSCS